MDVPHIIAALSKLYELRARRPDLYRHPCGRRHAQGGRSRRGRRRGAARPLRNTSSMRHGAVKLYGYFRSSASYRVRIALASRALPANPCRSDLRAPASAQRTAEFLALNPEGLVPVLVDGAHVVTPVARHHRVPGRDAPRAAAAAGYRRGARAGARAGARDRLRHPPAQQPAGAQLPARTPGPRRRRGGRLVCALGARGFRALEAEVGATSGDGRHMFGSTVSLADVCIVPQMYNARRLKCDLTPFPTPVRHLTRT